MSRWFTCTRCPRQTQIGDHERKICGECLSDSEWLALVESREPIAVVADSDPFNEPNPLSISNVEKARERDKKLLDSMAECISRRLR